MNEYECIVTSLFLKSCMIMALLLLGIVLGSRI
jgi:hypothetical protein